MSCFIEHVKFTLKRSSSSRTGRAVYKEMQDMGQITPCGPPDAFKLNRTYYIWHVTSKRRAPQIVGPGAVAPILPTLGTALRTVQSQAFFRDGIFISKVVFSLSKFHDALCWKKIQIGKLTENYSSLSSFLN